MSRKKRRGGNKIKRNEGVGEKAIVSCLMKTCMYNMEVWWRNGEIDTVGSFFLLTH